MRSFYLYVKNGIKSNAIIHDAKCGYCNGGNRTYKSKWLVKRYYWYGPFGSLQEAQNVAESIGMTAQKHSCAQGPEEQPYFQEKIRKTKYEPLRQFLKGIPDTISEMKCTYSEIEAILGFKLPSCVYTHRKWWVNSVNPQGHTHTQAWMGAGWRVDKVAVKDEWVQFRRQATPMRTILNMPTRALVTDNGEQSLIVENYKFTRVANLEPQRRPDGSLVERMPQAKFDNIDNLPLHKYGHGPFVKFRIKGHTKTAGVYAIVVDREVKYIGATHMLAWRINQGLGSISPKNCFFEEYHGKCRTNNLIYQAFAAGSQVSLWLYATRNHNETKAQLLSKYIFEWSGHKPHLNTLKGCHPERSEGPVWNGDAEA